MGEVNLFIQIFVAGAFFVFLAFAATTVVLVIYLTSLPERRRAPRRQEAPAGGSAD